MLPIITIFLNIINTLFFSILLNLTYSRSITTNIKFSKLHSFTNSIYNYEFIKITIITISLYTLFISIRFFDLFLLKSLLVVTITKSEQETGKILNISLILRVMISYVLNNINTFLFKILVIKFNLHSTTSSYVQKEFISKFNLHYPKQYEYTLNINYK